jgi:hypothetical protein
MLGAQGRRAPEGAMAIKVILVPMNASAACEAALATAFALARQLHAHVSALHVRADPRHSMPYMGEGMSGVVIQELMAAVESEAAERAAKARALFDRVWKRLRRQGGCPSRGPRRRGARTRRLPIAPGWPMSS